MDCPPITFNKVLLFNTLKVKLELIEYLPFELFKLNVILLSKVIKIVNNVKA